MLQFGKYYKVFTQKSVSVAAVCLFQISAFWWLCYRKTCCLLLFLLFLLQDVNKSGNSSILTLNAKIEEQLQTSELNSFRRILFNLAKRMVIDDQFLLRLHYKYFNMSLAFEVNDVLYYFLQQARAPRPYLVLFFLTIFSRDLMAKCWNLRFESK